MPRLRLLALVPAATLALLASASAAPGDLDSTFATGGVFTAPYLTPFAGDEFSIDIDAQGRPVVASSETPSAGNAGRTMHVFRLTTGGVLDTTFNPGGATPGIVDVTFPDAAGLTVQAMGVGVTSSGAIVAVASLAYDTASPSIAIARLTSTGGFDPGFDGDGRIISALSGYRLYQATVEESGRVLGGGRRVGNVPFAVRFTAAGALDTGFDGDGHWDYLPAGVFGEVNDIEPIAGGGLLLAMNTSDTAHPQGQAVAARLTPGGVLDTTFDAAGPEPGLVRTTMGIPIAAGNQTPGYVVAADAGGNVYLGGFPIVGGSGRFAIARFTQAGAPDAGWAAGAPETGVAHPTPGLKWLPYPRAVRVADFEVQTDGKLLAFGWGFYSTPGFTDENQWFLTRLLPSGALDASFAPSGTPPGTTVAKLGTHSDGFEAAVGPDGIYGVGFRRSPGPDDKTLVARFDSEASAPSPDPDPDPDPVAAPPPVVGAGATSAPSQTPRAPVPPAPPVARPPAPPTIAQAVTFPSTRRCASRRNFAIRLRVPRGTTVTSATVHLNGRQVAVRRGARLRSTVDLRSLPKGRFTVKITLTLADGRTVTATRRYRTCAPKRRA